MAGQTAITKLRGSDVKPELSRAQDNAALLLDAVTRAVNKTPIGGAAAPAWVPIAPATGFAAVVGQAAPASHIDALKYVHLKFGVANAAGCAANTAMLTLPQGQRPLESIRFAVRGTAATAQFINISKLGVVTVEVVIAAGGTVDGYVSFLGEQ